ncbi:MAG: hypothetical protein SF162_19445 [bacterium]|nr:hypothetical protein [bacterium]
MAETMFNLEQDLSEAEAMVKGLETYVRGTDLYGNMSGMFGGQKPSLTIGALVLRERRLLTLSDQLSAAQRERLEAVRANRAAVRQTWTRHYTEKMIQEGHSRLKAMNTFFEECADRPRTCGSIYLPEAHRRTLVQEIIAHLPELGVTVTEQADALAQEARKIDGKLRRFTAPGSFVWAYELTDVYPSNVYWWLYAAPPQAEREKG